MKKSIITAALLAIAAGAAMAQATPAGLWKTIDDETKAEKSLVRIVEIAGVFTGRIEKILSDKPDAKCNECSDERKDQPVQGMTIIRNVRPAGDDKGLWDGGDILDPNNGKVYRVRLKPVDGGKKLEVRGYIGAPLLGRTQTWLRLE
jgi:uncharacterized protein (DUF2147 family)